MHREDLIFYTNPQSRGQIVRWMLEEIGEPYKTEVLEYGTAMKSESYLKINPMGKVPTIVHNNRVVTECAAICAYLADAFPRANLAPALPDRHSYYRWLFFAAGPLEAAVSNQAMGFAIPENKQSMIGYGNFDLVINTLEKKITATPYITGEAFSAADVYVGSHLDWGLVFKTIPDKKAFTDYVGKLKKRPAYIKAKMIDEELASQVKV